MSIRLVGLLVAASADALYCTPPSAASGSEIPSLGFDQCLTQNLVDSWNADITKPGFNKEPFYLPLSLKNVTYNGVSMPFKHAISMWASWKAGGVFTTGVLDILHREVLGYNTALVCTYGGQHSIRMVGGCSNPYDHYADCMSTGTAEVDPPAAFAHGETWLVSQEENEVSVMKAPVDNLGSIGYVYEDGLFVRGTMADAALANDNVTLTWWETYAASTSYSPGANIDASQWFDDYAAVAADIQNYTAGVGAPQGPSCGGISDDGNLAKDLLPNGYNCSEGWYFTSHCAADKSKCVPVIVADYAWMGLNFIRHAEKYGYKYAISWFAFPQTLNWGTTSDKKFLLFCSSMLTVCHKQNLKMVWAGKQHPQYRPNLISSMYKTVWPKLQTVAPKSYAMLNRLSIGTDDHSPRIGQLVNNLRAGMSESKAFGGAACDWVKAHANEWITWLDRTCQPGYEFTWHVHKCTECAVDYASPDGEPCLPCSDGQYTSNAGQTKCDFCAPGEWRAGKEMACSVCSAGKQRDPVTDSDGCRDCLPGTSSASNGTTTCSPCAIGDFQPSSGQTACQACPIGRKTLEIGAKLESDCVCEAGSVSSANGTACVSCGAMQTSKAGDAQCSTDGGAIGWLIGGLVAGLVLGLLIYLLVRRLRQLEAEARERKTEMLVKVLEDVNELSFPMVLLTLREFKSMGKMVSYEQIRADIGVRNKSQFTILDNGASISSLRSASNNIIFFSHQWLHFDCPDPENVQYDAMLAAADEILLTKCDGLTKYDEDNTYIWADYCSVPQNHPRTQELAINSLCIYSSASTNFVAITPTTTHASTCLPCDFSTYNMRTWCRVEQLAFCSLHGIENMYIFDSKLVPMTKDQAKESVQVFLGELTCCRRDHEGMAQCDKEKLVGPILGLYGVAYGKHMQRDGSDKLSSYELIKQATLPTTIEFKQLTKSGKLVTQKRKLFGTLVADMEKHVRDHGLSTGFKEITGHGRVMPIGHGRVMPKTESKTVL